MERTSRRLHQVVDDDDHFSHDRCNSSGSEAREYVDCDDDDNEQVTSYWLLEQLDWFVGEDTGLAETKNGRRQKRSLSCLYTFLSDDTI